MIDQDSSNFVGTIPDHYDRSLGPVLFVDFAADMARRVAADAATRVLEIAAGTGIVTRQLRDLLPADARLTATDLNPPMLEVARTKFRLDEHVDFQPADATALPFADASFDCVVCQFGVMFFPDKEKAYRESLRVLAPRGRYLFSVWDSHRHNPFGRLVHELMGRFFPSDPPQFYRVPFGYHLIDPIKESLMESGFTGIKVAVLSVEKMIPDVASFARGIVYGNPLIDQIRSRGGVQPDRIVEAVAEAFRHEFGPDPARMPLQTITFEANKR
jgi:SAM-dependent methyltransferase